MVMEYSIEAIRILVVDDQEDVCRGLRRLLSSLGCHVRTASSAEQALDKMEQNPFHIVITDIKMEGMSGVDLFHRIQERWTGIEVILITGYGTIEMAVSCLQNGAAHFITKPFDNDEILEFVERLAYRILTRQKNRQEGVEDSREIIAESPVMQEVMEQVHQVAASRIPVLVQGESGTGKELIARAIHRESPVSEMPFLAINCAALPDSLLESELFGYTKGAFTGAHEDSEGLFQQAQGGTIFLDEVASMSMSFQGKLLRVVEQKVVRPLGASSDVPVNFRLIAATNRNLGALVQEGGFREDLLYRLQVFTISLPTLNERPEGVPVLAERFLQEAAQEIPTESGVPDLTPAAIQALRDHDWQGNVRELENCMKRALVVCQSDRILPSHFQFVSEETEDGEVFQSYEEGKKEAITAFQQQYITRALQRTDGNVTRAAELCGITRAAFQRIMKKLEIDRERVTA